MAEQAFLVEQVDIRDESGRTETVPLLGDAAERTKTHITVLAGANGTNKSRLLAAVVDRLCNDYLDDAKPLPSTRSPRDGTHGLTCTRIQPAKTNSAGASRSRPAAVLALSNLVNDKFPFPRDVRPKGAFYHYLGVRQATNLTTTGASESAFAEAVLSIAHDTERYARFQDWMSLVFGGPRELAVRFTNIRRKDVETFLESNNRTSLVRDRMRRRVAGRSLASDDDDVVAETARDVGMLFEVLATSDPDAHGAGYARLRLAQLSKTHGRILVRAGELLRSARRAFPRASLAVDLESSIWLPFGHLSSGEQNVISAGAKLVAYSTPGSFIAIDEPEVSLNVSWQQRYTDLVASSLKHAHGSHVLIATHSPHLISSLPMGAGSVLLIERREALRNYRIVDARFEAWGSEAVLYDVLGIPSASGMLFRQELAEVLGHIQDGGRDRARILAFLGRAERLESREGDALQVVITAISEYASMLS